MENKEKGSIWVWDGEVSSIKRLKIFYFFIKKLWIMFDSGGWGAISSRKLYEGLFRREILNKIVKRVGSSRF